MKKIDIWNMKWVHIGLHPRDNTHANYDTYWNYARTNDTIKRLPEKEDGTVMH